ncbi:hydrogenase expression/formation protein [Leptothrix discophora]|uniref:Hydrogenase expression/formation protein n=1 Tax=Leptothrix discophora TaxID=89 RepID=A0ABT9G1C1_LEPDI|nr:hydrogenase expression/formation protein [Leptothrix discophora]MDP4300284.1 hydrogenase expression/formation protein [Leptothrix discophora]
MTTPLKEPMNPRPFPIPVVAEVLPIGPGSQIDDEDGTLDYLVMPQGMSTWSPPRLPEPEDLAGHDGAIRVLDAVLDAARAAVAGAVVEPVMLQGLNAADLALLNQVLGEGEVSAQVLPDPDLPDAPVAQIQESVYPGVWRVIGRDAAGQPFDQVEVGDVPQVLREAAWTDGLRPAPVELAAPPGVVNAPALRVELDEQRLRRAGLAADEPPHVVNLTLLPVTPEDIGWLDHHLGTGRVVILSRGYGNCRITNCLAAGTWRLVYYNSQDQVILNTVEIGRLPEVACAAPEDLHDSVERLADVLHWVRQS